MSGEQQVILYIDDDPDALEAVRTMLESAGYDMVEAHSGEEGLRVYRERRPDLVICDLMMEEVDAGTSFVKEVSATGDGVPIYLLSSVGDSLSLTIDTKGLGLAGVFQKPVRRETLLAVLESRFAPG